MAVSASRAQMDRSRAANVNALNAETGSHARTGATSGNAEHIGRTNTSRDQLPNSKVD
jgi:hypothetical protein